MITKEQVQEDLDKIFEYLLEKDLLKIVADGISQGTFYHKLPKIIRVGQGFSYNLDKCLNENKIPFPHSSLFYCSDDRMVEILLVEFTIKLLNHLNGEN